MCRITMYLHGARTMEQLSEVHQERATWLSLAPPVAPQTIVKPTPRQTQANLLGPGHWADNAFFNRICLRVLVPASCCKLAAVFKYFLQAAAETQAKKHLARVSPRHVL